MLPKEKITNILIFLIITLSVIVISFQLINIISIRNSNSLSKVTELDYEFTDKVSPVYKLESYGTEFHVNHAALSLYTRENLDISFDGQVYEFNVIDQDVNYSELVYSFGDYGEYDINASLKDDSNNTSNIKRTLSRVSKFDQTVSLDYINSKDDSTIVVQPKYSTIFTPSTRIPASFAPAELTSLYELKIPSSGVLYLESKAAENFKKMYDALTEENIEVYVTSAFRDFQAQTYTYNYIRSVEGESRAEERVAIPGFSEHQLGLAVDLVNAETNYRLTNGSANTRLYTWLKENASKYGFYQTYKGQDNYIEEIWHWRYTGKIDD